MNKVISILILSHSDQYQTTGDLYRCMYVLYSLSTGFSNRHYPELPIYSTDSPYSHYSLPPRSAENQYGVKERPEGNYIQLQLFSEDL